MEITVYGLPHCGNCKAFCTYLDSKNLGYKYAENEEKITELAQANGILSAPVVEIDRKCYNRDDAQKIIEGEK